MRNETAVVAIIGAVLIIEGCAHLSRFQRLLDGGNSLLPTPAGYEELHLAGKQTEDDPQGLTIGPRLGYGSSGIVYHGALLRHCKCVGRLLCHQLISA